MICSAENRRATSQGKTFPVGEAGFTLIEMLVTISIMAILLAVAVPSFQNVALSSKLTSQANNFVASVQLARSEAIKRNATVTLCASSDDSTCTGDWEDGWIVLAGGTVVYSQTKLPNGFVLSGDVTTINFQPTGVGATAANLTLCRATPSIGSLQRTIRVSATGRPGVEKVTGATTCP
jgi:type IV fimbrial biogenesis protein FimT